MPDPVAAFRAVITAARGGGALIDVPPELIAGLGGLKQMRVVGTIDGHPFRSSTMPAGGGRLCIGIHRATRAAAGVDVGSEVEIQVSRDDSPRTLELAPELESAFVAEPALRTAFDRLSFSRRRDLAAPVAEAKRPETRAARLARTVSALRELAGSADTSR